MVPLVAKVCNGSKADISDLAVLHDAFDHISSGMSGAFDILKLISSRIVAHVHGRARGTVNIVNIRLARQRHCEER